MSLIEAARRRKFDVRRAASGIVLHYWFFRTQATSHLIPAIQATKRNIAEAKPQQFFARCRR